MPLTGREKATIFLSILGAEGAAKILRYLPDEVADLIAAGVNHLPSPSPAALGGVLEEFGDFMSLPKSDPTLSLEENKEPLTPLEAIVNASPRRVASYLITERIQIMAFVLSLFPVHKRKEILTHLPGQRMEVEGLLKDLREHSLSNKVKEKVIVYFSSKLS